MARKTITKNIAYDDVRDCYYAVLQQGTDRCGRRHRRTRTFATYAEAEAALRNGRGCNRSVVDCPMRSTACTLSQWLAWWMEEKRGENRADSTLYGYANIIRCHVDPELGANLLVELTPLMLQNYLRNCIKAGLRPNTVRKHYVLLNTALRRAAALGVLDSNPMLPVSAPQPERGRFTFYSPAQMQALFAAVEGTMMELAVKLAAYLGLRRSEITGLRWESVDLVRGEIRIQEVRTEVGGVEVVKKPKTATSVRRLGISGLEDLRWVLERAYAQRRSDDPRENVLLRPEGVPPKADYLTAQLRAVVQEHGLPKITMHGLRHSFASVANSAGVPMFDISRTLGHSSLAVTSNIYTHLFDETETAAISTVGQAIKNAR